MDLFKFHGHSWIYVMEWRAFTFCWRAPAIYARLRLLHSLVLYVFVVQAKIYSLSNSQTTSSEKNCDSRYPINWDELHSAL
jgi:hypothetical protein